MCVTFKRFGHLLFDGNFALRLDWKQMFNQEPGLFNMGIPHITHIKFFCYMGKKKN